MNVTSGPSEDRMLLSGMHTVCDLICLSKYFNKKTLLKQLFIDKLYKKTLIFET
jgi:hypothetical protein